eukprot:scaffold2552_cov380-Prasinococcus_capsulatus_cf.AAC.21
MDTASPRGSLHAADALPPRSKALNPRRQAPVASPSAARRHEAAAPGSGASPWVRPDSVSAPPGRALSQQLCQGLVQGQPPVLPRLHGLTQQRRCPAPEDR